MAEVLLFHHALGLTAGLGAFAEELRADGHIVHTPDLYDGHTFAAVDEGMAYLEEVGFGSVVDRGVRAADALPAELVFIGFSLGVMPAQQLAQTRPGARGAVFVDACAPVSAFGERWPDGVPVQVHGMEDDPIFAGEGDLDAARELVASTDQAELFVYAGDRHLFADASLASYDEAAASLLRERVRRFLSTR
jgi:dienelactone hydrolase